MANVRKWMPGKSYASGAVDDGAKVAEFLAEQRALIDERSELHVKLQDPEFRRQQHSAEIRAMANSKDAPTEDIVEDAQSRIACIDERLPKVEGVIGFLETRFEERARVATGELVKELQPTNIANVKANVIKALDLRAVADTERAWRGPLLMDGVPFSGILQGMPLGCAQPGGAIDIWLRRVRRHFPEIDVHGLAKKAGVEI